MLKGRYSLIQAERHLPRHSSEVFNSRVPIPFKLVTNSSMRQSLRFSVLHWISPSSRNRVPFSSLLTRRSDFTHATTVVDISKKNYWAVQFRDISTWAQRPLLDMPEKTGTRQATLGYVRDPQSTIWCVGLSRYGGQCRWLMIKANKTILNEQEILRIRQTKFHRCRETPNHIVLL
jgi:hypothetical protein